MSETTVRYKGTAYRRIRSGGELLEAVFRVQHAQNKKRCDSENCTLNDNSEILPYQDYARVFYPDENAVEAFHLGCFKREFQPDDS